MIIEPIINTYKIKYSILKELVDKNMTGEKLNIYINLDSIFSNFYRDNILEGIMDLKEFDNIILSGELINVVAHYRHFFWKYYGTPTTFYLYTLNKPIKASEEKLPSYFRNKLERISIDSEKYDPVNKFISDNMRLAILVSMYIQDCYIIPSNGLDPSLTPYHFINKHSDNDKIAHLILTTDKFDYQLLNMPNTYLLNLKWDNSNMVFKENIYDHYNKTIKYVPKNEISPKLYSLILSLIGIKGRSVSPVVKGVGYGNIIKKIDKLISSGDMVNDGIKNINGLAYMLGLSEYTKEIRDRFHILDLEYSYKKLTNSVIESKIENNIIDRYDNASLMDINSKYYKYNPLKLIELCRGVEF